MLLWWGPWRVFHEFKSDGTDGCLIEINEQNFIPLSNLNESFDDKVIRNIPPCLTNSEMKRREKT
jgi:hypothetical protein